MSWRQINVILKTIRDVIGTGQCSHHKRYSYSFEKAKTGAFRPHESFFDKGLTKENKDEYKFFGQHLRNSHFIFINLHGKS